MNYIISEILPYKMYSALFFHDNFPVAIKSNLYVIQIKDKKLTIS